MNKKLILFIVFLCYGLLFTLSENEMHLAAKQLSISVDKIKKGVPCWKNLKYSKSLIEAYKKKILKYHNHGKSDYCNYDIISVYDILSLHPEIEYIKCERIQPFEYKPFPISKFPERQLNKGLFAETFILKIPNGKVFSENGYVFIDDNVLLESMPDVDEDWLKSLLPKQKITNNKCISGRVAVITVNWPQCYFHWMTEVLAKLYMLKKNGVKYDWLYVPLSLPFMKETLLLCGQDLAKTIEPLDNNQYFQADELIVPSYPCHRYVNGATYPGRLVSYVRQGVIKDLRNTFLPMIKDASLSFAKKVFISRQDCSVRKALNEDDVFAMFEKQGFKRYCLSTLTFLEQISLFHNAEIIVGAHGAGLVNMLFCKPQAKIIEIFQARSDCTYFYLAQQLGLDYQYIKTQEFDALDWSGFKDTVVDLKKIEDFCSKFFGENKKIKP